VTQSAEPTAPATAATAAPANGAPATDVLRAHAEQQFAGELAALGASDDRPRPPRGDCRRVR
jgi:hypothetical protein